jgi:hypothetical protein
LAQTNLRGKKVEVLASEWALHVEREGLGTKKKQVANGLLLSQERVRMAKNCHPFSWGGSNLLRPIHSTRHPKLFASGHDNIIFIHALHHVEA